MAILSKRRSSSSPAKDTSVKTKTRPSAKLTSALSGPNAVNTRPAVGVSSPTSITSSGSGGTRPAITKSASGSNKSTSGLGKTLTSALAGAGAGVAGKMAYDKFFGKKPSTPKQPSAPVTPPTSVVRPPVVPPKIPGLPTIPGTKPPVTKPPVTKPPVTKPPVTKPPVTKPPVTKPPVTPKVPVVPKGPTTPPKDGETTPVVDSGPVRNDDGSITNADGSKTYTYDDGSTITVDADGNIVSSEESTDIGDVGGGSKEIVNDDGSITYTYDDGSSITVDASGNVTGSTDATDVADDADDDTGDVVDDYESGFFQDDDGNIYNADGELVYEADGGAYEEENEYVEDYYTDDDGYVYDSNGDLSYDPYDTGVEYDDSEIDYTDMYEDDPIDDTIVDEEEYNYDDYYDLKKGGFITMMKHGGDVRHFVDGGYSDTTEEVQDFQNVGYNYGEYDEPGLLTGDMSLYNTGTPRNTYTTADSEVMDTEMFDDGSYIEYLSDGTYITYDTDGNVYESSGGNQDSGNRTETFDDGSTITYDANGDVVGYTEAPDQAGNRTEVFDDGSSITYGPDGSVVDYTESPDSSIINVGSGDKDIYKRNPVKSAADIAKEKLNQKEQKSTLDKMISSITGSEYLGAGAAGAVLGALLGNSDLFSGGGSDRQAIDMTKVGAINPRTTNFGVGAPRYVTYDEYGARNQMPDLYGDELYTNLNAPGFNPVSEGDYDVTEAAPAEAPAEAPKMAAGGLADTYFTFGKAVDPLENLRNPQPMQQGQSGMPQAMPPTMPQNAPQGGLGALSQAAQPSMAMRPAMPPKMPMAAPMGVPQGQPGMPQGMRSGGLPALSNVPLREGRLDFRQGSAVHGPGDGQSDDIPAMLADGEYVIDAETVAQIGNGSTKAGAQALDKFRESIRAHKRSAPLNKIPPKTKALTSYLKKGK